MVAKSVHDRVADRDYKNGLRVRDTDPAMNSKPEWHNAVRIVWSLGGVVAVNEPGPDVEIKAGLNGRSVHKLRLANYASLFEALRNNGFPVLGCTFIMDSEQLEGLRPAEFRTSHPTKSWLMFDTIQKWRQIAIAASKRGQMPLMDIASRIASGLRYCQMRLGDLVSAYSVQLRGRLHGREAKEYEAFKDANSFEVYKAIHALFWEMAVLRDVLGEFVAAICFSHPKIRTMIGLRNSLKKDSPSDQLTKDLLEATDKSPLGWLAKFSTYRDCFTHVAPLEQAAGIACAIQDLRVRAGGLSVPQIYFPLPQDPVQLERKWSLGIFFTSIDELIAASWVRHDRALEPDALEYLYEALNQLSDLAFTLIGRSPIPPEPIHFGPEDIIGEIKITPRPTH